uniref:L antigen family member 3 n=1 Tax=Pseudonaja textilis TaxID=8673 RepID=A0A670YCD1_PSETE
MRRKCEEVGSFPILFSIFYVPYDYLNISELKIPFPSSTLAKIALGSLAPDPEPRKGGIIKELDVTDNILHVQWRAEEARILRVSINSFLEHLSLVVETMDLFGPPVA